MRNRPKTRLQQAARQLAYAATMFAAVLLGLQNTAPVAAQEDDPGVLERLQNSARDKIIYLQIHTELQTFEMYQKYHRHFKDEYTAFLQDIVDTQAYNDTAMVSQKAQAFTTSVRQQNTDLIYRAGDAANKRILQDRLDTVLLLRDEEGVDICGRYGALGPLGIQQDILMKYLPRLSIEADAILEAMIAGKSSDVSIDPMGETDMEAFIQYMYDTGVTLDQINLLASTTGSEEGYCGTVIAYYTALLGFEGAAAQRVRASTNVDSARN
jgi:hypothetical protein